MLSNGDVKIIVVSLIGLIMYMLLIPTGVIKMVDLEMMKAEMLSQGQYCKLE